MAILSSNSVAPFTWACVTPSLSPYECSFSDVARGLVERRDRQKAERTFHHKARRLSSYAAHASKSVVYRGPSSVDSFVQGLRGSTDQSLWRPFFAPLVLKSPTMGCWLYGKHQNNYVLCFGGRAAFFKVQSSIMASLLLFLEQAWGERSSCSSYVIISRVSISSSRCLLANRIVAN